MISRRLIIPTTLFFSLLSTVHAQNTPYTDYQYQLGQYRRNYSQFQLLKRDYLDNSTLDNEQKAILSVQQTISARELTMASFAQMLQQSISKTGVANELTQSTLGSLNALSAYYLQQSQLAMQIQTKKDLSAFSANSLQKLADNKNILDVAQVVNKKARLEQIQKDILFSTNQLKTVLSSKTTNILVKSGIDELDDHDIKISQILDEIGKNVESVRSSQYYQSEFMKKMPEKFSQIQSYQRKMVDRLIDLEKNYAH